MAATTTVVGKGALIVALTSLVETIADKGREACYVDLCAGTVLLVYYGAPLVAADIWTPTLWPIIAALAVTRTGDAAKAIAREAFRHGQTNETR